MYGEIVVEVHSGEGGQDSKLFIHDLAGAYKKFASQ
jgi:protein subunit release factor A